MDPTGNAVYQALDVCACTVDGKSGTLYFYEQGTLTPVIQGTMTYLVLSSSATVVDGTKHFAKLQGSIALQGIVYDPLGLTMGKYTGRSGRAALTFRNARFQTASVSPAQSYSATS